MHIHDVKAFSNRQTDVYFAKFNEPFVLLNDFAPLVRFPVYLISCLFRRNLSHEPSKETERFTLRVNVFSRKSLKFKATAPKSTRSGHEVPGMN